MKRISLFILTLLLLLTSLPTGYAIQKGDDKGGILNLPPFVDFEVKEKRKVDVIVDVGNTSKSIDEVNSLVNEYLRPALQADGLDYKIQVEKSSEGNTKFYYFAAGEDATSNRFLYSYDVLTHQSQLEYDTGSTWRGAGTYHPETGLLFAPNRVLATKGGVIPEGMIMPNGWPSYNGMIDSNNNVYYVHTNSWIIDWENNEYGYSYRDYISSVDDIVNEIMTNGINANATRAFRTIGSTYDTEKYLNIATLDGGGVIYRYGTLNGISVGKVYELRRDMYNYFIREPQTKPSMSFPSFSYWTSCSSCSNGEREVEQLYGEVAYSNETDEFIISHSNSSTRNGNSYSPTNGYKVLILDPTTRKTREIEAFKAIEESSQRPSAQLYMDGLKALIRYDTVTSGSSKYDWYYFPDYRETNDYILLKDLIGEYDVNNIGRPVMNIGDYVVFQRYQGAPTLVDLENGETYEIPATGSVYLFKSPSWYKTSKRYMVDILQEELTRYDAEKYYIRLDDTSLMQLNSGKSLSELATEINKQNVTYLALGNDDNKQAHQKLLNAIDYRGTFIDNTNIGSAMSKAAAMITNKKEADLHVLIANETLSLSAIKEGLKQVQTELQAENIISSIQYIQGTSTSKVFDLISQVNWRNDRNNYVVMFNRGSMSELNNVEYEVEIANELGKQYAGYIAIGTSANKTLNDRLIATNKSGGVFTSNTTMSTIKTVITKYVKDTAVKNPKRVTDTLVLNYDQETGEYSSDLIINTYYEDFENDPKFTERFKTTHDPTVYENHTGVMAGIGQYQPSPTTKFTKVGKYEMVVQVQDNPSNNAAFANFREWSLDSLSRLVLFVHRAPVADFTAVVNSSRRLTIVDLSYDLDRYSERNKGIVTATWKWKKEDDADWTSGSPPTTLAANTDYLVSLKVKDRDGAWSNEVIKFVTTKDSNQPPVALFTVNPKTSSWSKTFTLTDQSYDPDGDTITKREWIVIKDGKQLLTKSSTPTGNEIKNAAISAGLDQLGSYQIRLRVQDSLGLSSAWYQDYAYVVNHAPIAEFEPLTTTYRDTMNEVLNLTANPDVDGDPVTYRWRLMKEDKTYNLGTTKDVSFRIRDRGLGKDAVGTWSLELRAADPLGAESYVTHSFQVLNQKPTAEIISYPVYGYVDEPYNFAAISDDPDSEDRSSLQYFWKIITPSGKVITYYEKNLSNMTFKEKGNYTMEHWVIDQLGAESEVDKIEFTILNKLPIADFTRTPITTYRNVDIDFKSLGTDPDGWIEAYRYELLRDGLSPLTISTDADFKRSFSSIATFDIRHTVTDNDGASDSIIKQIHIINRAPKAEVTEPSGTTVATATEYNTLTPVIRWTMTDADNDPQVQYQLQLKNQSGMVLRTTTATTTANKYFKIPSGWLTEGPIYRVSVRVYDGYDWSDYSTDKYFYIMLNRPPVSSFTCTPNPGYEGDDIKCTNTSTDPDGDAMTFLWTVRGPNGYSVTHTTKDITIPGNITENRTGEYNITLRATDSKNAVNETDANRKVNILPLSIEGEVNHTDVWEQNRLKWNQGNPTDIREANVFFAGEGFNLVGKPTVTSSAGGSTTVATRVDVTATLIGSTTLAKQTAARWTGYIGQENAVVQLEKLEDGPYEFEFKVTYSNGVVKTHKVTIYIRDTWLKYFQFHKQF